MTTVYFHTSWDEDPVEFLEAISKQTPDGAGEWGNIRSVAKPENADYQVAFNRYDPELDPDRLLLFSSEPPISNLYEDWCDLDCLATFPIERHHKPQRWWVDRSYDELIDFDPPEKTSDLSWITTDKGREVGRVGQISRRLFRRLGITERQRQSLPLLNRGGTDGHVLRMAFLDNLVSIDPGVLDLYGRGGFSGRHYCGEVDDKWDGLADYRYSLAIENYHGPNYFSEKITDALLAWCMPIYWGCTNLEEYLPADSFVRIDIEDDDAPERVREIVNSDLRKQNIDAIAEARRRLLDEYQIWPTVERAIADVES